MQPKPIKNNHPAVWDMLINEMKARDKKGLETYGTRLQPFNGRDALQDAFEEALDLCAYLRQAIYERDNIQCEHDNKQQTEIEYVIQQKILNNDWVDSNYFKTKKEMVESFKTFTITADLRMIERKTLILEKELKI